MKEGWNQRKFKHLYKEYSDAGHENEELLSVFLNRGVIKYSESNGMQVHKPSESLEKYQLVLPGCLVLNNQQAWRGSVGVSAYRGIVSPAYHVYTPLDDGLDSRYMNYLARSAMVPTFELCSHGVGSIQRILSKTELANSDVLLPPFGEQRRIADYLDSNCAEIDEAIQSAESSLAEAKDYRKSLIAEEVMGRHLDSKTMAPSRNPWLGDMPADWKMERTKYCFEIRKRIIGHEGPDVLAVTNRGIQVKDLSSGKGQFARNYSNYQIVEPGDFIMNNLDLVTGWVDCSSLSGVTSPDYRVFRSRRDDLRNEYYRYLFQMLYLCRIYRDVSNVVEGVGWGRLQRRIFDNFLLPIPPIEDQLRIAKRIGQKMEALESFVNTKQSIIDDLKAYKQSLIYEVVTGKREV